MEELLALTPPVRHQSVASSNNSLSSFPTYGLIKVSNSDDSTSEYSFAHEEVDRGDRAAPLRHRDTDPAFVEIQWSTAVPQGHHENLIIPTDAFDRAQFMLSRIALAHYSAAGASLSRDFFLNRRALEGVVFNGSVKTGILHEVTMILRRFADGEMIEMGAIEPTLRYYEKLLDAFDLLNDDSDDMSTHSSLSHVPIRRTDSAESTQTARHKKRDSFFEKFTGKRNKRASVHALSPSPSNTNSRSRSISVATTATSASRSQRDQCTVPDYISLIESLSEAMKEVEPLYNDGFNVPLTRVATFTDEYLMSFVCKDIVQLSSAFMKKQMATYW